MSLGRGGATTAQWDLANSDCILIQGSNMAECHPVGYRFVMEARERGAKIIHVDPRFTRTSATADIYAPIRPGSDIVFLGALIKYVIDNEKYFKEYIVRYTNAATLIDERYKDTEDLDGVFSGYDAEKQQYAADSWAYRNEESGSSGSGSPARTGETFAERAARTTNEPPPCDETLQDPLCVFQILKRHFSRYTPEMVEQVCGTPKEVFLQIAETICANSAPDRTTAICYAVGWTQHTTGVQLIRTAAILQLLLGNIGRPGGGIMALRGHAAIQGSTDVPTLYNLLPGYIPMPLETDKTLEGNLKDYTAEAGWWRNYPKYMVSLLKAWYGEHATAENEWCYQYLPKLHPDTDYSYYPMMFAMVDKKIKGLFVMGENFAAGGPVAVLERNALRSLQWCVIREPFLVETAQFWHMDGVRPEDVDTEVIFMPAAWAWEKEGSLTNTQRLLQWHDKAVDPPDDARSESHFMYYLGKRLKALYADSTEERDKPLQLLTWDLPTEGKIGEPDVEAVLKEINGYTVADGKPVSGYTALKDDGTTACGDWIYSGVLPAEGRNLARSRIKDTPGHYTNHSRWGFAWPANRRILYNRASADPDGNPWSERKKLVWWDPQANGGKGEWTGYDVPDFTKTLAPHENISEKANGGHSDETEGLSGCDPFIMHSDGRGWLFVPQGLKDGPLPTHYEPYESPVPNLVYPKYPYNPVITLFQRPDNPYNGAENPEYPYVITTYRLTEHHTSGAMSRWNTWLSELQPELFVEIDPDLAREKGIAHLDWATVWTSRAQVEAKALVTGRIQPLRIQGRTIHVVGFPYHFGPSGVVVGDVVNDLIGVMLDPNVHIHESKALTCNIRKGRKDAPQEAVLKQEFNELRAAAPEGGAVDRMHSEGAEMHATGV